MGAQCMYVCGSESSRQDGVKINQSRYIYIHIHAYLVRRHYQPLGGQAHQTGNHPRRHVPRRASGDDEANFGGAGVVESEVAVKVVRDLFFFCWEFGGVDVSM